MPHESTKGICLKQSSLGERAFFIVQRVPHRQLNCWRYSVVVQLFSVLPNPQLLYEVFVGQSVVESINCSVIRDIVG
jgi:hypothetical protein